jgi:phosphate-selective porin OprO/OprP
VLRNEALDDRLFWALGVFRFVGSADEKDRVDVSARVGGVPWLSDDGGSFVHLGASYAALFGSDFGLEIGSRPETFFGDKWVQASGIDAENGHLFGVELAGVWKGFSYQSEIILSMTTRSNADLLLWGGYAQVSYFITGETRRYLERQGVFGRVAINHAFSWKKRTWGAFELAARYSYLDLDDEEVRGGIMNDFTLGLNWYILPNVRAMANYVHAHVNGLGTGHIFDTRFQIDF